MRGFLQSTVYAKVAGYVKSMDVDKGDQVKAGQLLGVLESPEVDQQVAAAEADLVIKKRTLRALRASWCKKDFVSEQDFETARAQYEVVARDAGAGARAFSRYQMLRAPFAGTITARYVDPGALVPAATGLDAERAAAGRHRRSAPAAHPGVRAAGRGAVRARGRPRCASRVDQQPDLGIDGADHPLRRGAGSAHAHACCARSGSTTSTACMPGTFVHVTLSLKAPRSPVVDSSAVLLHADKPAVAVVRDARVHFVPVRAGLDDGKTVQIIEGLQGGEMVALALPSEIAEGAP